MKIHCKYDELVPIDSLNPYPRNRNTHTPAQIERLAKLIDYYGVRAPIVVASAPFSCIAKGHGTLMALKELGVKEVPVVYQDFDNEDDLYGYVQSDNAISEWSQLDLAGIHLDLPTLGLPDIDLLGIKDFEFEPDSESQGDPDETPEPPKVAKTKRGELWTLGTHRLLIDDCTVKENFERLMTGKKADLVFTSPPYNLGNNAKLRGYNGNGDDSAYLTKTDHKTSEEYLMFLKRFTTECMTNASTVMVNIQLLAGNKFVLSEYWNYFKNNLIDIWIWDKEHAPPSAAARVLNSVFEFGFCFSSEEMPSRAFKTGPTFRGTVDNIFRLNPVDKKDPLAKDHGAVFPVAFAEHFIQRFSDSSVIEPFCGSGTTLISCEKLNRSCFAMEIEPVYADVILTRFAKFSGKDPVREDGVKWSEFTLSS